MVPIITAVANQIQQELNDYKLHSYSDKNKITLYYKTSSLQITSSYKKEIKILLLQARLIYLEETINTSDPKVLKEIITLWKTIINNLPTEIPDNKKETEKQQIKALRYYLSTTSSPRA